MATGIPQSPLRFLDLPIEIRQMVYNDVFSCDTFENFPGRHFDLVKTNRQIYRETFDFAMKKFRSFSHAFYLEMSLDANGSFGFELVLDRSVTATNYEHPPPEKVVAPKALQQLKDVEILFGSYWADALELSTRNFESAIDMIAWIFRDQTTPMSLIIGLPVILSAARFGKLLADLEPLASLPAVCDVKLYGDRHWRWMITQWDIRRRTFLLNGKKQKSMDELMDGFLISIGNSIKSMAVNTNQNN